MRKHYRACIESIVLLRYSPILTSVRADGEWGLRSLATRVLVYFDAHADVGMPPEWLSSAWVAWPHPRGHVRPEPSGRNVVGAIAGAGMADQRRESSGSDVRSRTRGPG